jgi:hypothetical protein
MLINPIFGRLVLIYPTAPPNKTDIKIMSHIVKTPELVVKKNSPKTIIKNPNAAKNPTKKIVSLIIANPKKHSMNPMTIITIPIGS